MLQFLLDSQKAFQERMGHDFSAMTLQEKAAYIKEHTLWATDELHEMIHEIPFAKTWSKKYELWDEEKIAQQLLLSKEEFIDFLHFSINIALALNLSEEEIVKMYKEKNKINYQRQEDASLGYITTNKSEEF